MTKVKINGRSYDLKMTWAAHAALKDELGDDYTQVLHGIAETMDLNALSVGVAACCDGLEAEDVFSASPAITPLYEALTGAMAVSMFGNASKTLDRLLSLIRR